MLGVIWAPQGFPDQSKVFGGGALASKCKKQIETSVFYLSFDQVHKNTSPSWKRLPESLDAPSLDCTEFALRIASLFQIEKETNQV
jgi:hypothetical protein